MAFIFDKDGCVHIHPEVSRCFCALQLRVSAFKDSECRGVNRVLPTSEVREEQQGRVD